MHFDAFNSFTFIVNCKRERIKCIDTESKCVIFVKKISRCHYAKMKSILLVPIRSCNDIVLPWNFQFYLLTNGFLVGR